MDTQSVALSWLCRKAGALHSIAVVPLFTVTEERAGALTDSPLCQAAQGSLD